MWAPEALLPSSPPGVKSSLFRANFSACLLSSLGKSNPLCCKSSTDYKCVLLIYCPNPFLLFCYPSIQLALPGGYLIVIRPLLLHLIKLLLLNAALSNILLTPTPMCSTHLPFFSQHVMGPSLWTSYMSSFDVWGPAVLLPLCDYYLSECAASAG